MVRSVVVTNPLFEFAHGIAQSIPVPQKSVNGISMFLFVTGARGAMSSLITIGYM